MANFVPLLPAKIAELALWQNTSENKTGKHILPPFFSADEKENEDASSAGTSGGDNSSTGMTESWIKLPDETDDPRWDKHGFRRDAARLSREEAFESNYAARLEAQEARWGRRASGAMGDEMPERAELKKLARTGIPTARRRAVWPHLCRAAELRAAHPPDYIETLLSQPAPLGPSEAGFAAERQVDLDLLRTFPGHRLLSSADGAAKLRNVLIAYARRNPMVGYVQGMGFVAALLLIFIDDAHEAFWCLCAVVETLLPVDFYSATLLGLRVEQAVFAELLQWKMPKLAAHLTHHAVVPELFATRWFVALFANALPVETTLRVWDAFLLEGSKVLHRVGLALLRVAEPRLLACRDQQELLCAIQEEQANCLDCERLLSLAFDKISFLRSFPRARVETLRRKHRVRLEMAEGTTEMPADFGGPNAAKTGSTAKSTPAELTVVAAREADADDSSDEEGGDGLDSESAQFDVVSFDDVHQSPTRDFWL